MSRRVRGPHRGSGFFVPDQQAPRRLRDVMWKQTATVGVLPSAYPAADGPKRPIPPPRWPQDLRGIAGANFPIIPSGGLEPPAPPRCPGGGTRRYTSGGGRIRTSAGVSPPPSWAASHNRK